MSYNGSGTFQINTSGQPVVTGTVISSSAFNALTADLATGLSTAITKDGQTATTVRIPFAAGINSSLTTDTSSGSTGSIYTAGGVGITKGLFVGGTATFSATPVFSALTASSAVATDASKNLVSVTNTGTGNNVLATSPTITTPTISQLTSAAATALTLQSAGTTAITADTSQNVGIGTTSPSGKLHVTAAAGSQTPIYFGNQTSGARTDIHVFSASNSDGYIFFERSGASENGYIRYSQSSDFMSFQAASAERMRIDSSGNLMVDTTTNNYSATQGFGVTAGTGTYAFVSHASGTSSSTDYIAFSYAGTRIGNIIQNGTTGVLYNLTSDYRLKDNAVALTGAKDFVMGLQPKTWDWWDGSGKGVGFIAHEFMEVAKYSGFGEKDAVDADNKPVHQSIQPSSSEVMANIVAFIQEQQALITQQAAAITSLTARIVALEAK
jgi:hypothetical protein